MALIISGTTLTLEDVPSSWVKQSVIAATTTNITLSGTQTIDGIALSVGDRVLVKDQTASQENGIYVVSASTWSRSFDANTASEIAGAQVAVSSGTTNGGTTWDTNFKSSDTLDTTAMTWNAVVISAGPTLSPDVVISGSSSGSALRITQTGAGNALLVEDSANVDSTPFVIQGTGRVGIGTTTPDATSKLNIGGTSLVAVSPFANAVFVNPAIPTSVSLLYNSFRSEPTTDASVSLAQLNHFYAADATLGSGAALTNQMGFLASAAITAATNNYGFYSDIASATGRWNFYAAGTAPNYMAGPLGIGATTTGDPLRIAGTINHAAFSNAQTIDPTIGSGVTGSFRGVLSRPITQAATFTLSNLIHFYVNPQTKGANSTITNQYGFFAESTITDATANVGFYSNIASASGRWNFYAAGTAANYFAGDTGIGTTPTSGKITLGGANPVSGGSGQAILANTSAPTTLTGQFVNFYSYPTSAASANISQLLHFYANTAPLGAGTTMTQQIGFAVESTLTGATTNYGFYSGIASAANRFNIYAAGTAPNYFAGVVGVGATASSGTTLHIGGSLTGAVNGLGVYNNQAIQSDVTTTAQIFTTYVSTAAASFTLGSLYHFNASLNTIGAGSSITSQYGYVAGSSLIGATNNYGFYSGIASGTNRWNFYAAGTAANYFAGDTTFNTGLTVNGTTNLSALTASTALALDASKNIVSVTNTGTGNNVLATSPVLTTPNLGTPSAATLTNATGLPVSTGISGLGTGVATALAVNTGSSGAFVTNGGALGTPSSGTVTNLTGTASININGTVGATTPTTGAFTTLSASSLGLNGSTSGTVTVNTAATAGTWTLTLPTSAGTNGYVLSTDGTGVTSWIAQSGGGGGVTSFSAGTTGLTPNTATTGAVTLAGTLAVANGGTGVTTSTGTGSVVLSNSPALGSIGIGTSAGTAIGAVIGGTLSGSTSGASIQAQPTIGSGITGEYTTYKSRPITQAATFTLANMVHFYAQPQAKGAGSTITAQYGFLADTGLTDASTVNYAFYSGIAASGTTRWAFYSAGSAPNYFNGVVRVGSSSTAGDQALNVGGAIRVSGTTTANQTSAGTIDFTSGATRFLVWGASGTQGTFSWWTGSGALGATQRMTLNGSNNLGLATSTFGTSATNTFSVASGTAPTSGVADTVQFYSSDLSAGNTIPSFYTEGTNVGTGTPTANRTIAVNFNGTIYYLLASTIP